LRTREDRKNLESELRSLKNENEAKVKNVSIAIDNIENELDIKNYEVIYLK
jgi:hypothetical protein